MPEELLHLFVVQSGDSGGEEETQVVLVSSMVRGEYPCVP